MRRAILRRDGASWTPEASGLAGLLAAGWTSTGEVRAFGPGGVVIGRRLP